MKKQFKSAKISLVFMMSASFAALAGGIGPSISLQQTVGTDTSAGVCGTDSLISVTLGTPVNYCYTVTNTGDVDLSIHDLDTSAFGLLVDSAPLVLAMGESVQINDVRNLSSSTVNDATWTASEAPFEVLPDAFVDISGTGTALSLGDEGEAGITIPFSFTYFGNATTEMTVGSNGAAIMGTLAGTVDFSNLPLPTDPGLAILAPFWDDLDDAGTNSETYWEVQGTAPNQVLLVQWHEKTVWNGVEGEDVTFQLALFETTNEVQFRYNDVEFGGSAAAGDFGASATVGADSGDTVNAIQVSFNQPVLSAGLTISLDTNAPPPQSVFDEDSTTVVVNVPEASVTPNSIDSMVDSAGSGSEVMSISNVGNGVLEWSADEANAPAVQRITDNMSFYAAPTDLSESPLADNNVKPSHRAAINRLGGGNLAWGVDVRNGFLGNFDLDSVGDFSNSFANARPLFAGDFIDEDFTQLFVIDNDTRELLTLSLADGTETIIGAVVTTDPSETISGMAQDPSDGTVYVSTTIGTNSFLYTLDVVTATLTPVGEITGSALTIAIAVSASGDLYGFDIGDDNLYAIDKTTGAAAVVGNVGLDASFAQGMDFDNATNTLYLAAYTGGGTNQVLVIDTDTGAGTSLGSVNPSSGGGEIDALAIPNAINECYADTDIPWMSLDSTSGVVGQGDSDDVTVSFDASALSDGIYNAQVCVFTNDPSQPLISVPVTLQVGPDDLIFADGFEGSL